MAASSTAAAASSSEKSSTLSLYKADTKPKKSLILFSA
jgi:hypothetical protein